MNEAGWAGQGQAGGQRVLGKETVLGFAELWDALLPLGRDAATGGYRRYSFTKADMACREWFASAAAQRGMRASTDRNGNLWAWWDAPAATGPAVLTGSHLVSVPNGGAFDGPLGVVSAFAAIDQLRAQGFAPARRVAVAAFCEEEGGRFGLACLGSRCSPARRRRPPLASSATATESPWPRPWPAPGSTRTASAPMRSCWPALARSWSCTS